MKHGSLSAMTICISISLFTFSCSKGINEITYSGKEKAPSMLVESAKEWYKQHVNKRAPTIQHHGRLRGYWKNARMVETTDKRMILVIPAEDFPMDNKDFTFKRFLIFRIAGHDIADGRIVELLGRKYNIDDNLDFLLKNYTQNTIAGFNGSVLQYSVSYKQLYDATYENGLKKNNVHVAFKTIKAGDLDSLRHVKVSGRMDSFYQ